QEDGPAARVGARRPGPAACRLDFGGRRGACEVIAIRAPALPAPRGLGGRFGGGAAPPAEFSRWASGRRGCCARGSAPASPRRSPSASRRDMARVRVGSASDVPVGEGRVIDAAGKTIALFNVGRRYYAIDNTCAHRGGPLGEGDLDGAVVTCPWHG